MAGECGERHEAVSAVADLRTLADDIESVVWFRDNTGRHDYIPTDPSVDQAFSSMVASTLH